MGHLFEYSPSRRDCCALLLLGFLLSLGAASAQAQEIAPVPVNFVLNGAVNEWDGIPPTVVQGFGGTMHGAYYLWAGASEQGLVIAGRIQVVPWTFTLHPLPMAGWALDIWLSVVEPFEFPNIEFDDSFCTGMAEVLKKEPAACLQWVKDQGAYRELLHRQFARMWRIAPDGAEESYALAAYDHLSEEQRTAIGFARPAGLPVRSFATEPDGSQTFELLIPWEIFPPANRLNVERLQLAFNLEYLQSVPVTVRPNYETFQQKTPWLAVNPPISARITSCGQPLLAQDQLAFYFLNRPREIDTTFTLQNHHWAYAPYPPPPDDLSPMVRYQKFFTQALTPGEYLCGPNLSYRHGSISKNFAVTIQLPPAPAPAEFPVKLLDDGTRLIRSGPAHMPLPEASRHSYDIISMSIYALTPSLQGYEALKLGTMLDGPLGYEIEISDDWRTVTEFKQRGDGKWSSETFCLNGHLYRSCGKSPESTPPKTRILTHN